MNLSSLPLLMVEPIVRSALLEDLGRAGDLTTDAIVPAAARAETVLAARQPGVLAGLDVAALAFRLVDPAIDVHVERPDGTLVAPGDRIAIVSGPARGMLTAERVALNFLGHLSGVATATRTLVDAVRGHKARICCTRKTMPGMRALQKYAVRAGGGVNHRFGLDDAVLVKDNHVRAAGSITSAVESLRAATDLPIEVECDTLGQVAEALAADVDTILLDNMTLDELRAAVALVAGRARLEASGGVTLESIRAIAETGVDEISVGALTHSARSLDVSLELT